MRLYGLTEREVHDATMSAVEGTTDDLGNQRVVGLSQDRRRIVVVIAADNPGVRDQRISGDQMTLRAEYDSEADALSIILAEDAHAESGDEVHPRGIVAVAGGKAVEVQVLYPSQGLEEPLASAARHYELDAQALEAAARSAIAAPDRRVVVEVDKGRA